MVGHLKYSNMVIDELYKKQVQLCFIKNSLLLYCRIRWESVYIMLNRVFINRYAILNVLTAEV